MLRRPLTWWPAIHLIRDLVCDRDTAVLAYLAGISPAVEVPQATEFHKIAALGSGMSHCSVLIVDGFRALLQLA